MMPARILHVAHIELTTTTGMGRIACEWRAAAERMGMEFIHIGTNEVGPVPHRLLFPIKARKIADRLARPGSLALVHEPGTWAFRDFDYAKVAFSHGIELRGFEIERTYLDLTLKRRVTQPVLRWLGRRGLVAMDAIFVSNHDDANYLVEREIMRADRIEVFRNGADPSPVSTQGGPKGESSKTIIYNAGWLKRKGTDTLVQAAQLLSERGIRPRWLLIGTGRVLEDVAADWPEALRPDLTVVPSFQREEELSLLSQAEIFVLPSYFEGQPLALLQAMGVGLCCITSNCCGQRDLIRHGQNGLLFTPGDARKLADQIQMAWEDAPLRHKLGLAAGVSVAGRTWAGVTDELMLWVKEIATQKKAAP